MNQGCKAKNSGDRLENKVEALITSNLKIPSKFYSRTKIRDNILLKNVPYTNIYGNRFCRSEFVVCFEGREIRVECKAQYSKGSVDEKLPYLFLNFTEAIKEKEAIIVMDGDGFKYGAKDWIRGKCKNTKVSVMNLGEFESYLKSGLPENTTGLFKSFWSRLWFH